MPHGCHSAAYTVGNDSIRSPEAATVQVVRIMRICAEHHKREGRHMAAWAAEIVANVQCSSAYTAALQGLAGR